MTPVQMTSALDTKPPHHSVEAIVTQVLLNLTCNAYTPTIKQQLTSVSQDQHSSSRLFSPIPMCQKTSKEVSFPQVPHSRPKTKPTPCRSIPGHQAARSNLLLVLQLLHFRLCCSSSSGRCMEVGFSGRASPSCGQQALAPQGAESPEAMLSVTSLLQKSYKVLLRQKHFVEHFASSKETRLARLPHIRREL